MAFILQFPSTISITQKSNENEGRFELPTLLSTTCSTYWAKVALMLRDTDNQYYKNVLFNTIFFFIFFLHLLYHLGDMAQPVLVMHWCNNYKRSSLVGDLLIFCSHVHIDKWRSLGCSVLGLIWEYSCYCCPIIAQLLCIPLLSKKNCSQNHLTSRFYC